MDILESIDLNLNLTPLEKIPKTVPVRRLNEYIHGLQSIVDNPEDVEKYNVVKEKNRNPETKRALLTQGISVYCDYVIITSSSLSSSFDDFIEWKKQKGVDIELVTTSDIYQNYTGDNISGINDNAGKIRQFLYDAYSNGLEYALLGGTDAVVPVRYGWGSDILTGDDYEIPA